MLFQKKIGYILLGGLLALGITFGGAAVFAQVDDGDDVPDTAVPEDDATEDSEFPGFGPFGQREGFGQREFGQRGFGQRGFGQGAAPNAQARPDMGDREQALADALGIPVEDLQAAHNEVRTAAIEQAVADGLLTQEQADQILSGEFGFGGGRGAHVFGDRTANHDALADALGISVEELEAAHEQVRADQVQALLDEGLITQEQIDRMEAHRAVRSYLDTEGLSATVQEAYEAAIAAAVADGAITQAQADEMLESGMSLGRGFGHGKGFGGGRGFRGGPGGFNQAPQTDAPDA